MDINFHLVCCLELSEWFIFLELNHTEVGKCLQERHYREIFSRSGFVASKLLILA